MLAEVKFLHMHEGRAGVHVVNLELAETWRDEGHVRILRTGPSEATLMPVAGVPEEPIDQSAPAPIPDVFNTKRARGKVLSEINAAKPAELPEETKVESSEILDDISGQSVLP